MPDERVEDNTSRATARLPGLDIEIIHRLSLNNEGVTWTPVQFFERWLVPCCRALAAPRNEHLPYLLASARKP